MNWEAFRQYLLTIWSDPRVVDQKLEDFAKDPGQLAYWMERAPKPLRQYQEEIISDIMRAARASKRILVQSATGSGKSVIFAELIRRATEKGKQTLFLVHRRELIYQADRHLKRYGIQTGLIMSGEQYAPGCQVQLGSVPTVYRRLKKIDMSRFAFVVLDECHHASSRTNKRIIESVNGAHVLGFTATPIRKAGAPLGDVFDVMVQGPKVQNLIDQGHLCDVEYMVPNPVDLRGVSSVGGDYSEKGLQEKVVPKLIGGVVDHYLKYGGKKGIIFTCGKKHSLYLRDEFARKGRTALVIDSNTKEEERAEMEREFRVGETGILLNVGIFCLDSQTEILTREGWKGIDDIGRHHHVANWKDDGSIFFDRPRFVVKRPRLAGERMVRYASPRHSFRVTGDHRMIVRRHPGYKFYIAHAIDLVGKRRSVPVSGKAEPEVIEIEQEAMDAASGRRLAANSFNLRRNNGLSLEASLREAKKRISERTVLRRKNPQELSLCECAFIGFWIGDGSVSYKQSGGLEYTVSQSSRYQNIINWIRVTADSCGFDFVERIKGPRLLSSGLVGRQKNDHHVFSFCRGTGWGEQKRRGVFGIEPYLCKDGTDLFWGLSSEQFWQVLNGLDKADGVHGSKRASLRICGANKTLFDLLQAIAVCRGFDATISIQYSNERRGHKRLYYLNVNKTQDRIIGWGKNHKISEENEWRQEQVWCVTSTTGNIITRRDGHVTITGNTEGYDVPDCDTMVLARPTKSLCLYLQCTGRGMRPKNGGKLLVIDHGANVYRHGRIEDEIQWSLTKSQDKDNLKEQQSDRLRKYASCANCGMMVTGRKCYACGHEITPIERARNVRELRNCGLILLDKKIKEKKKKVGSAAGWNSLVSYAAIKGRKLGYAVHLYKARYGSLPWLDRLGAALPKGKQWELSAKDWLSIKEV